MEIINKIDKYLNEMIAKQDQFTKKIIDACFPSYKGRQIGINVFQGPKQLDSYWEGGHKDEYVFYDLATGKTKEVHTNHPYFEKGQPNMISTLPEGIALVKHTFSGSKEGIAIYVNPENFNKMITHNVAQELSWSEKVVLASFSFKSSYAGISDYRKSEAMSQAGISSSDYETARESLKNKKLLTQSNALTIDGKNARIDMKMDLYKLRSLKG